jgi:hypothetical protein
VKHGRVVGLSALAGEREVLGYTMIRAEMRTLFRNVLRSLYGANRAPSAVYIFTPAGPVHARILTMGIRTKFFVVQATRIPGPPRETPPPAFQHRIEVTVWSEGAA